jgi:hypothetical protein
MKLYRRPTQNRIRFLRQSLTLAGYGTPTFEEGIQNLLEVQKLFDRHIPANKLDECTIIDKCGDALGIHLTNRYFTPRHEAPTETPVALSADIDPSGILAALTNDQFFYGEQNVVKYYSRNIVKGGAIKYVDLLSNAS